MESSSSGIVSQSRLSDNAAPFCSHAREKDMSIRANALPQKGGTETPHKKSPRGLHGS